jgi:hypothetical protein
MTVCSEMEQLAVVKYLFDEELSDKAIHIK